MNNRSSFNYDSNEDYYQDNVREPNQESNLIFNSNIDVNQLRPNLYSILDPKRDSQISFQSIMPSRRDTYELNQQLSIDLVKRETMAEKKYEKRMEVEGEKQRFSRVVDVLKKILEGSKLKKLEHESMAFT